MKMRIHVYGVKMMSNNKYVRWGILGTGWMATAKFLPAFKKIESGEVIAIASRSKGRAQAIAEEAGIKHVHGDYESLIANPDIDAIYNPLPNNLHLDTTIKALEAGKHVLCEKPLCMSLEDVRLVNQAADSSNRMVMEAFMYRFHPQWRKVQEIIASGALGDVRALQIAFSFYNDDPNNIRNQIETGGGALYDVGCYAVQVGHDIFGVMPSRVVSSMKLDENFGIDALEMALMDYEGGRQLSFMASVQASRFQMVQIIGTKKRLQLEIPFNTPETESVKIYIDDGADLRGESADIIEIPAADQYALELHAFSNAILQSSDAPYPLRDAMMNASVIDALFRSAREKRWVEPEVIA